MLSSPKTVASHRDAVAPFGTGRRAPACHASPHNISASSAPVLITERELMFATAVARAASQSAAVRRPWIIGLRQRLSLRSSTRRQPRRMYPPPRPSYIEAAALADEVHRP
jgi:hypothetical protein